jgi:hypothetical protein
MFKMTNPVFNRKGYGFIFLLNLSIFCAMAILSPYALGVNTEWCNHHLFDHHHEIELDEEILLFTLFVSIIVGLTLTKTGTQRYSFGSIHPVPQLPPPKHI